MDVYFVAMKGDKRGEATLSVLIELGYPCKVLGSKERASNESVAIFTPLIDPGGGRYLCCSAFKLIEGVAPNWALSAPFRIAIRSTKDQFPRPNKPGRNPSLFIDAIRKVAEAFKEWYPDRQGFMVPWAHKIPDDDQYQEWLNLVLKSCIGVHHKKDLSIALAIESQLKKQGGYYVSNSTQMMHVSPDCMTVDPSDLNIIEINGKHIFDLWEQTNLAYLDAIKGKSGFKWVAEAVEGPLTEHQRKVQRRVAINGSGFPLFARADLSSFPWFLVEVQERIGGLGLIQSWLNAIRAVQGNEGIIGRQNPVAEIFVEVVKNATGKDSPVVVLICPEGYEEEQSYLAQQLEELGVIAVVVPKKALGECLYSKNGYIHFGKTGQVVDFIYRREVNAAIMADTSIGMAIIKANLAGRVVVEPPLNMLFDTKVPMALAHDVRLQEYIEPEVRGIVPPTVMMPTDLDTAFTIGGEQNTLRKLIGRGFVVKYAGPNMEYGFGGRGVYNTRDDDRGIQFGISQAREGHPWIVQMMDTTRYRARFLNSDGLQETKVAARIMFHFAQNPNGGAPKPFAAIATNRPHWKAIGSKDSIVQEVRLKV